MTIPDRVLALHRALERKGLPHAFGGALALAYWTSDPRGTSDVDLNVFIPAEDAAEALPALPSGVAVPDDAVEVIMRDGQTRLWWKETPIDIFFDNLPIHDAAAQHVRTVAFAGTEIPVLGPIELAVFKAMFDRTRDWADIEAMIAAETLDLPAVREALATMLPSGDRRFARLEEAARLGRAQRRSRQARA